MSFQPSDPRQRPPRAALCAASAQPPSGQRPPRVALYGQRPPRPALCAASAPPLRRLCAASAPPLRRLCAASAPPLRRLCAASAPPLCRLCAASAPPLRRLYAASAPPLLMFEHTAYHKLVHALHTMLRSVNPTPLGDTPSQPTIYPHPRCLAPNGLSQKFYFPNRFRKPHNGQSSRGRVPHTAPEQPGPAHRRWVSTLGDPYVQRVFTAPRIAVLHPHDATHGNF